MLAHLGEVEARGIHRERACSSLYTYCVYELRISEDEAQRRCRAARLARQFPILLEMLAEASLHLTGILLLGPHLTDDNCGELLARARFRTKREFERLVAQIAPCRDVPSRIVPLHRAGAGDWMVSPLDADSTGLLALPRNTWAAYVQGLAGEVRNLQAGLGAGQAPPRASDEPIPAVVSREASSVAAQDEAGVCTPASDVRNVRHDRKTPASSGESQLATPALPAAEPRYKVQFTADQAYVDLLEQARNLLQHELPTRDLVAVQRRALELLVHKLSQRKHAACEGPRRRSPGPVNGSPQPESGRPLTLPSVTHASHSPPKAATRLRRSAPMSASGTRHSAPKSVAQGRYIPAEVRRRVWERDEARCAYVDARGQRCREQAGLEFHHQHPHARGGPPNVENLALRCGSHNDLAAEQDFGRDVIREKRAHRRSVTEPRRRGGASAR